MLSRETRLVTHPPTPTRRGGAAVPRGWVVNLALSCVNRAGAAGGDDAQVPGAHTAAGAEEEVLVGSITGRGARRTRWWVKGCPCIAGPGGEILGQEGDHGQTGTRRIWGMLCSDLQVPFSDVMFKAAKLPVYAFLAKGICSLFLLTNSSWYSNWALR